MQPCLEVLVNVASAEPAVATISADVRQRAVVGPFTDLTGSHAEQMGDLFGPQPLQAIQAVDRHGQDDKPPAHRVGGFHT